MQKIQTQVLVVAAGPVGLTAAMDLASRGIDVAVAEIRHAGEPPNVKCNHVSARSMEVFRRLDIVRRVRDAGLPADFPNDCAYRTAVVGRELARIPIPCGPTGTARQRGQIPIGRRPSRPIVSTRFTSNASCLHATERPI